MKLSQFAIIAILLLSVSAFAQEEKKPSPETDKAPQDKIAQKEEAVQSDRWHGMILDVTTEAQAIESLGKPDKRAIGKLAAAMIGDWLSKQKDKESTILYWKDKLSMKSIGLVFQKEKLVEIQLIPNVEIRANSLDKIYNTKFELLISRFMREAMNSIYDGKAYQRDRGETFSNKNESSYYLGAKTEKSFIEIWVSTGLKEQIKRDLGSGIDSTRPGKATIICLFSRTLENRDGEDVLK